MYQHFIIISSSYTDKSRIALHYLITKNSDLKKAKNDINKIVEKCGEYARISTHILAIEKETWKSVYEYDAFFSNIKVKNNVDEFIDEINKNKILNGLDIAKYILVKRKCTHLELEKLVYLCYAEYLCKYHEKMFEDEIYAFRYGPVIKTIYNEYKNRRNKIVENQDLEMAIKSRILFADKGIDIIYFIDEILKKCVKYNATNLINITHSKNSPWDVVYDRTKEFNIIPDDVILKNHKYEKI